MTKRIVNAEQLEAAREAARAANPNLARIDDLRAQIATLSREVGALVSDDEKYCNLMLFLSKDFDSRSAAVRVMSDGEIADHLFGLFIDHAEDEISEAILDEAMARLGHSWDDEEDQAA